VTRILVIDDDASIRFLLRGVLEMEGYSVVEADNGYNGLQCYWAELPDVVITDMQMPVMDGLQMITELRRACPTANIIAMSGGQRALKLAKPLTQRTFEKPLPLPQVLAAVQELVSASETPALAASAAAASHHAWVNV
jgi:two-component system nitrogen regulation response regulator NtrX